MEELKKMEEYIEIERRELNDMVQYYDLHDHRGGRPAPRHRVNRGHTRDDAGDPLAGVECVLEGVVRLPLGAAIDEDPGGVLDVAAEAVPEPIRAEARELLHVAGEG